MRARDLLLAVSPAAALALPVPAEGLKPLTLEAIFGGEELTAHNPTDVSWSADGQTLVYRLERDGRSTWWRHDVASGRALASADWSVVGQGLRGLRPGYARRELDDAEAGNRARRTPALHPGGTRLVGLEADDLYLLDLESGQARFLTDDPEPDLFPTWSPDGRRLAFVKAGDLYWLDPSGGPARRLTDRGGNTAVGNGIADWAYEEELGVERSFWWSPDGERLAYVQYDASAEAVFPIADDLELPPRLELQRYPHAGSPNARVRLGVVGLDGGPTRWLDLGPEADFYLPRAGFTPDGKSVWFEWLSRDQKRLELRLADPASGASRSVLVEQERAWVNVRDDLLWVDAGRFVWASERDGYRHLYLYGADGALLARLTSGPWQVEKLYGLDAARQRVFFQSTEPDPRERHVYVVGLDGRDKRRLSPEPGTHEARLAPGGRHWVDLRSSLDTPTRAELRTADGRRLRELGQDAAGALAAYRRSPIELGTLAAEDGTRLHTAMVKPPDFDPARRYPVLVHVYGGPHVQIVRNEWDDRRRLYFEYLAQQGLVVFWLDNRGSAGRGKLFESGIDRRLGELETTDQLAGVSYLKGLPFVDPARLGVYGGSYGGYMTLRLMAKAPGTFRAGLAYAPVTDWRFYDTIYTERYMGRPEENAAGYRASAPLGLAAQLGGRLLLMHGTMDNNVHFQNTLALVEALTQAGKPFELVAYPRVRHGLRTSSRLRLDFHRRSAAWLLRELLP